MPFDVFTFIFHVNRTNVRLGVDQKEKQQQNVGFLDAFTNTPI